jgi:hypothetical protein
MPSIHVSILQVTIVLTAHALPLSIHALQAHTTMTQVYAGNPTVSHVSPATTAQVELLSLQHCCVALGTTASLGLR